MSDITSTTTTEEAADINAYYAGDQAAWDAAIESGEVPADLEALGIDYEDLIAAYVTTYGILPTVYLVPDAYIAAPDTYDYLWDEEVVQSLTELGALNPSTSISAGIDAFFADLETAGLIDESETSDLLNEANDFIDEHSSTLEDGDGSDDGSTEIDGLMDIATLYVQQGDLGMAMMMFGVAMEQLGRDMNEEGLDVLGDLYDEQGNLLDDLSNIDPDASDAGLISQEISTKSSANTQTINTVIQIMADFQKSIGDLFDSSSNISEREHSSNQVAIRNMA